MHAANMTKSFFLLLSLSCMSMLHAQDLNKEQMKEDLNFLMDKMEEYHPNVDRYNPNIKNEWDALMSLEEESYDPIAQFSLISRMVAAANEGHYGLGSWEDKVHKGFLDDKFRYLPIAVRIVGDRIFIWDLFTEKNDLERGHEIISINSVAAKEILDELRKHLPSDGDIRSYQNLTLNNGFNWMYYLYIEQTDKFLIKVKDDIRGRSGRFEIPALTRGEMGLNVRARRAGKDVQAFVPKDISEVYKWELEEEYALLSLKSFSRSLLEKYKIKAKDLYKDIFKELSRTDKHFLIIDLRSNYGGRWEMAYEMLPYIQQKASSKYFKKSFSWKGRSKSYKTPSKSRSAFKGKIYVLINGRTFSSAASLARYLKEFGGATIIGEEGGSRYDGFSAGSQQVIYLPNSNFRIGIPRYRTEFAGPGGQTETKRGLIPDFAVEYSVEDLLKEADKELALAKSLISMNK
ncbi:MAG: S41 family peptidase [Bacteroidota bacterium]